MQEDRNLRHVPAQTRHCWSASRRKARGSGQERTFAGD